MYTGIRLSASQIRQAVRDLKRSGAVEDRMRVVNPTAVINDALIRLGKKPTADVKGYYNNNMDMKNADYSIIRGTYKDSQGKLHEHSQLGDSSGLTKWDPGFRENKKLNDNKYLSISF